MSNDMPPSIGTQGGGQQSGVLPEGGGGGNAIQSVVKPTVKSNINKNLVFIFRLIMDVNICKKNRNCNSLLKIMPI
jgi:hypothetical protein